MGKNVKGFITGFLVCLVLMGLAFVSIEGNYILPAGNIDEKQTDVDDIISKLFIKTNVKYDSKGEMIDSILYKDKVYVPLESFGQSLKLDFTWEENSKEILVNDDTKEKISISNNRDYNWYIDQKNTGEYADDNCGPSAAVMAGKWFNKEFDRTVEDAREKYRSEGGWWYTGDITSFLGDNNIPNEIKRDVNSQKIIDELKKENIVILCIDTTYLKERKDNERQIGKFYGYSGGHFVIVKGVTKIDDRTYFEVYDPNNWGRKYEDGEPMGKDRFYNANELIYSATNWWDNYIVVYSEDNLIGNN